MAIWAAGEEFTITEIKEYFTNLFEYFQIPIKRQNLNK